MITNFTRTTAVLTGAGSGLGLEMARIGVRLEDIMQARNPSDPFAHKPAIGDSLRAALRGA